jgi:hypothetical protein
MLTLKLKRHMSDEEGSLLSGKFLDESHFDTLITQDTDGYSVEGDLLFRFRKNQIPLELLKAGVDAFKGSISWTEGRGLASGGSFKRIRKDGTVGNTTVGHKVQSGAVGYMDENAMIRYCRKTAFTREHFEKFKQGVPFVEKVDELYQRLCPEYHRKQMAIARGTNQNYRIADTSFTTVTVNKNFQTAVHKDAGDFPKGFGNLIVYREGTYSGAYFCLPEFRVAVDLRNTDILFVNVHRWHGNTPFREPSPDYLRIAFVMYYREYMVNCKAPKEELQRVKMDRGGFLKL